MINKTDINWGFRAHDLGRQPLENLAEKISKMGFHNIQLALPKALEGIDAAYGSLSPGMGRIIKKEFAKKDIVVSVLGCYINPVHPDVKMRENHLNRFIEHLKYCRDFGCSLVGTETGALLLNSDSTEDIDKEENFQNFITSLKTLVDAAEKLGSIVAIEGVADKDSIYSHKRMTRMLETIDSPNLGVIYDPVNFLPLKRASESDKLMEEAFELFGDRMVAIHAKDFILEKNGINKTIPSGKGLLNYELLLKLIRKNKPMIPVLLENNTLETIDETISFVNRISAI